MHEEDSIGAESGNSHSCVEYLLGMVVVTLRNGFCMTVLMFLPLCSLVASPRFQSKLSNLYHSGV